MYTITKEIRFCYGHRLLHHKGKCRHLHGHSARALITLASEDLDALGMVCDFSTVKERIGPWIDATLDHNLLLYAEDPLIPRLQEAGERFMVVDENPTAEFIAKMIFEYGRGEGLPVEEVRLYESDGSFASYRESGGRPSPEPT